jgi:hypothetical protein
MDPGGFVGGPNERICQRGFLSETDWTLFLFFYLVLMKITSSLSLLDLLCLRPSLTCSRSILDIPLSHTRVFQQTAILQAAD